MQSKVLHVCNKQQYCLYIVPYSSFTNPKFIKDWIILATSPARINVLVPQTLFKSCTKDQWWSNNTKMRRLLTTFWFKSFSQNLSCPSTFTALLPAAASGVSMFFVLIVCTAYWWGCTVVSRSNFAANFQLPCCKSTYKHDYDEMASANEGKAKFICVVLQYLLTT